MPGKAGSWTHVFSTLESELLVSILGWDSTQCFMDPVSCGPGGSWVIGCMEAFSMSTVVALVYLFRKPVHVITWGQLYNIVGLSEKRECWALYTWNVGIWYWGTCLQGRNGHTDVKNGFVDVVGKGESGMNGERSINIYTLSCVKWTAGEKFLYNTGSSAWHSVMT